MRDKPDAADLLSIARTTLLEQLLPHLPADQKYNALLVAAAMAIAARESLNGSADLEAERRLLADLLGDGGTGDKLPEDALTELNARFAAQLRAGEFDARDERQAAAFRILRESTLGRLDECNPRYPKQD